MLPRLSQRLVLWGLRLVEVNKMTVQNLAIVLGPIAEPTLRQSLLLSSGDPSIFFVRPIAGPITVIAIILILLPLFKVIWTKVKSSRAETPAQ